MVLVPVSHWAQTYPLYRTIALYWYPPLSVNRLASIEFAAFANESSRTFSVVSADLEGDAGEFGRPLAKRMARSHHLAHPSHSPRQ